MKYSHILGSALFVALSLPVFADFQSMSGRDFRRATAWAAGQDGAAQIALVAKFAKKPAGNYTARPSPVKFMWVVRDKTSGSAVVVNQGANILLSRGAAFNADARGYLDVIDMSKLQAGILQNISPDLFLEYKMGDGKGRNLLLWTAADCPSCVKLEKGIDAYTKGMNGVVHTVLTSIDPANKDMVSRIWCSGAPEKAWTEWMRDRKLPTPAGSKAVPGCSAAYDLAEDIGLVLQGAGWPIHGTPSVLYESGVVYPYILKTVGFQGQNLYEMSDQSGVLREGLPLPLTGWKSQAKATKSFTTR